VWLKQRYDEGRDEGGGPLAMAERKMLLVQKMEEEDGGIAESTRALGHLEEMDEWKRYFVWKVSFIRFRWTSSTGLSEDGKKVTLGGHSNAIGDVSFSRGVHRWRVRVGGLDDTGFWGALGVTSQPGKSFAYRQEGIFTGYSGAGNIFSPQTESSQGVSRRWKNGDVITMVLDCDKHTIAFWINQDQQPTLPTLNTELWPWANGYSEPTNFTLLD